MILFKHIPVMPKETIQALNIQENGIYVDATAGGGGHAELIYSKLSENGQLILIDRDNEAVNHLKSHFENFPNVRIKKVQFSKLKEVLKEYQIKEVNGILVDLGVSTFQLLSPTRGFSIQHFNAPLDMRMGEGKTALEWLNESSVEEIEKALITGGNFKNVNQVAQNIKQALKKNEITTVGDLIRCAFKKVPPKNVQARFIQAIRVAVNEEFKELKTLLLTAREVIKENGRLVTITFHSGEARLVKEEFQTFTTDEHGNKHYYWYPKGGEKILPSPQEKKLNKRANAAVLRYATRGKKK